MFPNNQHDDGFCHSSVHRGCGLDVLYGIPEDAAALAKIADQAAKSA